jgi:hypothetical protein
MGDLWPERSGRIADDDLSGLHVTCDYRSRADQRSLADADSTSNNRA